MVEPSHDFTEHDAECIGWRLVVIGEPSSAGSWIGAREFGKEKLRLMRPCELREIAEPYPRAIELNDLADRCVRDR